MDVKCPICDEVSHIDYNSPLAKRLRNRRKHLHLCLECDERIGIKTKERLDPKAGRGLRFGVVVTLREMNGENRIDDFIKMCMMRGWVVSRLDVHTQVDVYVKAEEEITFE